MKLRLLLWFVCATALLLPLLFTPTFISGHDVHFHLLNTHEYSESMRAGIVYPRWMGTWYGGLGAPIGISYVPLVYLASGAFSVIGLPSLSALKIVLWLSMLLSAESMFRLARRFISPVGAVVAGLLYLALPYRMVDLYLRMALPELVAFLWMPLLLLLLIDTLQRDDWTPPALLGLTMGALLLTHVLVSYMMALAALPVLLYGLFRRRGRWLALIFRLGTAGLIGLMLAAAYLLPLLVELPLLNLDSLVDLPYYQYENNFLTLKTAESPFYFGEFDNGLTFSAVSSAVIGLLALAVTAVRWRAHTGAGRLFSLLMLGILTFSLFMTFASSAPLWSILPGSDLFQFPWRWQTTAAFAAAYLGGAALAHISPHRVGLRAATALLLLLPCLYSAGIMLARSDDALAEEDIRILWYGAPAPGMFFYVEGHMPIWGRGTDYASFDLLSPPVTGGALAQLDIEQWTAQRRVFHLSTTAPDTLNIRTFWYPGWQAQVNGQTVPLAPHPDQGTIMLPVPAGASVVALTFTDTPLRTLALLVSLLALLIGSGLLVADRIYRRNAHAKLAGL